MIPSGSTGRENLPEKKKIAPFTAPAALLAAAGLLILMALQDWPTSHANTLLTGELLTIPRPLIDFSLVAENNQPYTRDDLLGHWTIIFAGYTYCPDVCPNTLALLKTAQKQLGEDAKRLTVLFLSVDPERDTPEHLARYIRYFDPDFRAVTAPLAPLETLAANLGIVFLKVTNPDSKQYAIDHSAQLILINPQGQLAGFLSPPFTPEILATDLKNLLRTSP